MKLWFLLAVMPGASDTLQKDIQGCDGIIACSLPGVQPLPQHHSVPRDQDPIGCRAGTPVHETCCTEDTWVAFPQCCCCSSSMRFAEHPPSSLHLAQWCWLKCLYSHTEGPSESLCWFTGDTVHPFFLSLWSMGVCRAAWAVGDRAFLQPSLLLRDAGSLVTPVCKSVFVG